MNFDAIEKIISTHHLPSYHLKSLIAQIHQGFTAYDQLTSWPKSLRQDVAKVAIHTYKSTQVYAGQSSTKALLTFEDGVSIETVLIQTKPDHHSVCLSCQSGCAMGCTFCATGSLGLIRSLTAEEITDQLLYWRQTYPNIHIKSIVFMGMGEPLANQIEVFKAIDWFHSYYGIGYRHITLSTCGLPQGILALAKTYPQINLAVSLHAADQGLRQQLMPIAGKVTLIDLAAAINIYLTATNRQVTFEYLLLNTINDTNQHLNQLVPWLRQFPANLVHVNLIGYNQANGQFTKPSRDHIYHCLNYLKNNGVSATIRKSQGEEIAGACGQLSLQLDKK